MATGLQWNRADYTRDGLVADISGVGRYSVCRREKGSRQFLLKLNGTEVGLYSDRADAVADAERAAAELPPR